MWVYQQTAADQEFTGHPCPEVSMAPALGSVVYTKICIPADIRAEKLLDARLCIFAWQHGCRSD